MESGRSFHGYQIFSQTEIKLLWLMESNQDWWRYCPDVARELSWRHSVFLIFINNLPASVKNSFTGIFCDDTLLAKEIVDNTDAETLQNDLNQFSEWTKIWGMSFNVLKCKVMSVTNKTRPLHHDYTLDLKTLLRKDSIKYLGVTTGNKLSFNLHILNKWSIRSEEICTLLLRLSRWKHTKHV